MMKDDVITLTHLDRRSRADEAWGHDPNIFGEVTAGLNGMYR